MGNRYQHLEAAYAETQVMWCSPLLGLCRVDGYGECSLSSVWNRGVSPKIISTLYRAML
jgi:hypothetical protein